MRKAYDQVEAAIVSAQRAVFLCSQTQLGLNERAGIIHMYVVMKDFVIGQIENSIFHGLLRKGDMRDDAPYPVGVLTDAENLDGSASASRGTAAPWVVAETVDPAVECYKDTGGVDHAHGADIAVPDRILAHSLLVGVFARLFDGGFHGDLAWTLPLNTKDTYKDTLPGLEGGRSIHHSLVAKLGERDKGLHTEDIHKDSGADYRYNTGFAIIASSLLPTATWYLGSTAFTI